MPFLSFHVTWRTSSTTSPGFEGRFSTCSSTRRPTMASASSPTLVFAVSKFATTSPRRITVTLSVIAMISRSLWVMRMTVFPWSRSWPRMRKRWSASSGVSTPVGSSRISVSAPLNSALRISTRCCRPTGSSPTMASGSTSISYSSARCFSVSRAFARAGPISAPPSAPSTTFSSTVKVSTSMKCWCTMPMPWAMASEEERIFTASPLTRISPLSAV